MEEDVRDVIVSDEWDCQGDLPELVNPSGSEWNL
jgi:hypothetical protein